MLTYTGGDVLVMAAPVELRPSKDGPEHHVTPVGSIHWDTPFSPRVTGTVTYRLMAVQRREI